MAHDGAASTPRVGKPFVHQPRHRRVSHGGLETYKGHSVDELQLNIKEGVRGVVEFARKKYRQMEAVTKQDCLEEYKVSIPATDEMGAFTSKSHAPRAFAHLRYLFNIQPEEMLESICGDAPLKRFG